MRLRIFSDSNAGAVEPEPIAVASGRDATIVADSTSEGAEAAFPRLRDMSCDRHLDGRENPDFDPAPVVEAGT